MADKVETPTLEKKIEAGEKLTPAEEKDLMSMPKTGDAGPSERPAEEKVTDEVPDGSTGIKKPKIKEEEGETDDAEEDATEESTEKPSDEKDGKTEDPERSIASDTRTKLELELEKPEGAEDLTGFSNRERGIFWELRKERLKRQRAEQEADELKFERMKREITKPAAAEESEEEDLFADREEDDLLTVKDVKKLLAKRDKVDKPAAPQKPLMSPDEIRVHKIEADAILSRKGIKDFFDVIDYAEQAIGNDMEAAQYLRTVKAKGNNVALAAYHLIKGSSKWAEIEATIAKGKGGSVTDVNKKRAEKIEDNSKKIRTTGGGGNPPAPADEYSFEEVANMSPREFGQLPKKTRDAMLKKFGSNPNVVL